MRSTLPKGQVFLADYQDLLLNIHICLGDEISESEYVHDVVLSNKNIHAWGECHGIDVLH